ncbi:hypothetical protein JCM8547_000368 [Rhodosporidiobolus lusitaniae]
MARPLRPPSPDFAALDREIASLDGQQLSPPVPSDSSTSAKRAPNDVQERGGLEGDFMPDDPTHGGAAEEDAARLHNRIARARVWMLLSACCLSVGSHYATYTLGPIKKSLHTSEGGFAALITALELANTVTPLLSGFLVPRFGAATCGLVATGSVSLGQLIVCLAQDSEGGVSGNLGGMVFGLLIFGAGISPLAVVQETIILKHNSSSSRFVARSVALGLVLGKTSSFAAAWSSDRLHSISPRLPFFTAAGLAFFSFSACVLYAHVERSTSRLLASSSPSSAKPAHLDTAHPHRPLRLSALASFGDPFWLYLLVCALAGIWYTTNHLSSHFLQAVYEIPQAEASSKASVLLALSTVLYPLIGWTLDKRREWLGGMWVAVPALTATTYFALLMLPAVLPPVAALLPAAVGIGSGPLLLVLVVPRLVEPHQAATALGAHKSLEMAGAIIFQTLCGFLLSLGSSPSSPTSPTIPERDEEEDNTNYALSFLFLVSLVMLGVVVRWWSVIRRREEGKVRLFDIEPTRGGGEGGRQGRDEVEYGLLESRASMETAAEEGEAAQLPLRDEGERVGRIGEGEEGGEADLSRAEGEELRRGRLWLKVATGVVVLSWVCFFVNLLS